MSHPAKKVALPDHITYDMVVEALKALGLESGYSTTVTLSTSEVTVEMGVPSGGGSIRRTYITASNWPVRFQPKEET